MLVDWTRGKNLIFSSAAPSVNELRGPYDVANLSSLLGLSMERAKAAISKNCRYEHFLKPHSIHDSWMMFIIVRKSFHQCLQDSYSQCFEEKTIFQGCNQS